MAERQKPHLQRVLELTDLLSSLVGSYRYLIGGADELNRITLAHRDDVEDAVDRADDLGDIIDKIISELKKQVKQYLYDLKCEAQMSFDYSIENPLLTHKDKQK